MATTLISGGTIVSVLAAIGSSDGFDNAPGGNPIQ